MAKTIQIEVFSFDELGDEAKEKARAWYRDVFFDWQWWDGVYDDAKQCLKLAGFEVENIYFSGFSSQGDGACFEGLWDAADVDAKAMREHAPKDKTLHQIADGLTFLANTNGFDEDGELLIASIKHRGHYSHEHCTEIDSGFGKDEHEIFAELARDAMRWIYRQLEAEYEYLNSDEQIDESIRANEYDFTASGSRTAVV